MTTLRTRKSLAELAAVLCLATVGLLVTLPRASSEEGARPGPPPVDPEKAKKIWTVEARVVSAALEIKGEDAGKVSKAYVAAQQDYLEKSRELPWTRESFEQRRQLAEKASAGLKEALTKAVGAEKTEKLMGILMPFSMSSFRLDRMVGDLIAFELPKEKAKKAILVVLENNRDLGKAFNEARESGSWEGIREKMQELREALDKELSEILSEKQMAEWKEKYAQPFGGRRRQQ
jgi:hypothetical protein